MNIYSFSRSSQVCAQLLWENHARVLVDFSPGGGMMARIALSMGVKIVLVCLNEAHMQSMKKILAGYVRTAIEGNNTAFCPVDKQQRLDELRPARLKLWQEQKGIKAEGEAQGAGRQPRVEAPKPKDTPKPAVAKNEEGTGAGQAGGAAPTESVADLLKKWAWERLLE